MDFNFRTKHYFAGCSGMKMKSLIAPKWVNAGENTKLVCDYDLGRDVMYSIKWFKDGPHEVYRYIPTNQPVQYKSFKTPGVLVDVSAKRKSKLILNDILDLIYPNFIFRKNYPNQTC